MAWGLLAQALHKFFYLKHLPIATGSLAYIFAAICLVPYVRRVSPGRISGSACPNSARDEAARDRRAVDDDRTQRPIPCRNRQHLLDGHHGRRHSGVDFRRRVGRSRVPAARPFNVMARRKAVGLPTAALNWTSYAPTVALDAIEPIGHRRWRRSACCCRDGWSRAVPRIRESCRWPPLRRRRPWR